VKRLGIGNWNLEKRSVLGEGVKDIDSEHDSELGIGEIRRFDESL
jgi:hypothetical protein